MFDNVAEDRLTREHASGETTRYELLNFSVGGFGPIQMLADMDRRVVDFQFNALLYTAIDDLYWVTKDVVDAAQHDFPVPYPHVKDVMREAGLSKETSYAEGFAKMKPYSESLLLWTYQEIVRRCQERGVVPMAAYIPHMTDVSGESETMARKARQMEIARQAGFVVLDLTHAYDGAPDMHKLWIAPWDSHPNAEGHRMLADALYQALTTQTTL